MLDYDEEQDGTERPERSPARLGLTDSPPAPAPFDLNQELEKLLEEQAEDPWHLLELAEAASPRDQDRTHYDHFCLVMSLRRRNDEWKRLIERAATIFATTKRSIENDIKRIRKARRAEGKETEVDREPGRFFIPELDANLRATDLGNAHRLVRQHGANLRHVKAWRRWYVWDGRRWEEDATGAVERLAKDTAQRIHHEAAEANSTLEAEVLAKWAIASRNEPKLRAMVNQAWSEQGIAIRHTDLDSDRWLFNCANGTIDLRTGTLRPARREDLITKLAPVAYDPAATCPHWETLLDRCLAGDRDLIGFVQRAVGYSLTGLTNERCFFVLHGPGDNGKSTFLWALSHILGEEQYARSTDINTFTVKHGEIPADIAALVGARVVTASEGEEGVRLAESRMKRLTGGDEPVSARFMRRDWFEFYPTFKIWFGTNEMPDIRGGDAIWNRCRAIGFDVAIPKAEQDPYFAERRLRPELAGILAWAVRGCLAWQREGLGVPPAVRRKTAEFRQAADVVARFIEECCTTRHQVANPEGLEATADDLYGAYRAWARSNGEPDDITHAKFGRQLAAKGFLREKVRRRRGWKGIRLDIATPASVLPS